MVLSTHVLPQVDEMCTHICLINRARAILAGTLEEIRAEYGGNVWRVHTELGAEAVGELPGVASVKRFGEELLVELDAGAGPRDLLRELSQRGDLDSFTRFVPDLENIFIRAVEEDHSRVD